MPHATSAAKAAYNRRYYRANKRRFRAAGRRYYTKLKSTALGRRRHRERVARWRAQNVAKVTAYNRAIYQKTKRKRKRQNARWYQQNKTRVSTNGKRWRVENPDRAREINRRSDQQAHVRARRRQYAEEHRDEKNRLTRSRYQETKAEKLAANAAWHAANPKRTAEHQRRYRNKMTDDDWDKVKIAVTKTKTGGR